MWKKSNPKVELASKAAPAVRGRTASSTSKAAAPPIVDEVLRSSGRALDPATRSDMESSFGHDFSKVRVHTDNKAAQSAQQVNADAYTVGQSIVFNAGHYSPHLAEGKQLLAHELSHVVQQSRLEGSPLPASIAVGSQNDPLEGEADTMAAAALNGRSRPASTAGAAAGVLQRQPAGPTPAPTTEFSGCDPALQADLKAQHPVALGHVDRAIVALAKGWNNMNPVDQSSFQTYFDPAGSGDIDESFVSDVRDNYKLIKSEMSSLTFDCDPSSSNICGTPASKCKGNLMWTCFGNVHVCPVAYNNGSTDDRLAAIIHESAHNALHTTDREYSTSKDFKRLTPRGGIGWRILRNIPVLGYLFRLIPASNDALYNPDSYSGFAMQV
ncbi:MAG TPA: DUF4157 domain-containing protein [Candidatus Angelobacter sp.]